LNKQELFRSITRWSWLKGIQEAEFDHVWDLQEVCYSFYERLCELEFGDKKLYEEIVQLENTLEEERKKEEEEYGGN